MKSVLNSPSVLGFHGNILRATIGACFHYSLGINSNFDYTVSSCNNDLVGFCVST